MAKSQIGAVIGVEGAREYQRTLESLTKRTKLFASEMKALTSSFDGNYKSLVQLEKQKKILQKSIEAETDKLKAEKAEMDKIIEASQNAAISTQKWTDAQREVQTQINETTANINELEKELKELGEDNALTLMAEAFRNGSSKTGEVLKSIGDTLTKYVTVPLIAGIAASIKVASDFQSSFTGVRKTVEEIVDENGNLVYSYEDLEKELRKIPLETASTYEDVMSVAEAAGQLAVPADKIAWFARNIIMLADSTNIAAKDGAISIAQFMNIMGDETDTVDKFGSSLVALGNKTATDEASILALATRLASAGKSINLSTAEILGLSAAMSAVGVTAEAGGTAMSTTIQLITKAVAQGSDDVEKFAQVTSMSAEEFSDLWRTKPVDALQRLLAGMGNLEGGGEELITFMDELGWSGIRQSDLIRRLTLDYDGVSRAVDIATESYISNEESATGMNQLTEEATKRYEDFASEISQFKESLKQLADVFGKEIIPVLQPLVEKATELITKFSEMDQGTKDNILKFVGFIAIIGPVIAAIGNLMIWSAKLKDAFSVLKGAEGIAGVIGSLSGGGGLIGKCETLASTITDKLVPALGPNTGLAGALALIPAAFFGARAAADQVEKKMFESAEACEYVASRYHWSEEKVNEFGYTWDENGHLVEMANTTISESTQAMADSTQYTFEELKAFVRDASQETAGSVSESFDEAEPELKQTAYQFVKTGVEEIRTESANAYEYGSELANNFASGISDNVGVVESAVSSLAAITRAYLHFSEPDKGPLSDFHTWMPDMMKGLADDIDANVYLVDDALANVVDRMNSRMSGGSRNITLNNTFTINNGNNIDRRTVNEWADMMTDRVNENLGRMYG